MSGSLRLVTDLEIPGPAGGALNYGSGDGTSGGMDRIASIEAKLGEHDRRFDKIETEAREHFRWTMGTIIGSTLATILGVGGIVIAIQSYKADVFSAALSTVQANAERAATPAQPTVIVVPQPIEIDRQPAPTTAPVPTQPAPPGTHVPQ